MMSFTTGALSSDDTLSALGVSAGTLSPDFASGTTAYTDVLPFDTDSVTVTATTTDPNATEAITQADTTGTSTVAVTAQDGSTQDYTVKFSLAPATTSFLDVAVLVVNANGGTATSSDFIVTVLAPGATSTPFPGSATGTLLTIDPSQHFNVNISHIQHYDVGLSGDCNDPSGLPAGSLATCTITEIYNAPGNGPSVIVGGGPSGNGNGNDGGVVLGASVTGEEGLQQQIAAFQAQLLILLQQYLALLQSHGHH
jgi:hypothetical protein